MAVKKRMFRHDLKPDYSVMLTDVETNSEGEVVESTRRAVDLSTATAVRVIGMITVPGGVPTHKFDRSASGTDSEGNVTMEWQVGDTDTVGLLSTEVEVMWTGSKPQTFRPPELVQILEDFGGTATEVPDAFPGP